jgi:hypothetical protein
MEKKLGDFTKKEWLALIIAFLFFLVMLKNIIINLSLYKYILK